MGAVGVSIEVNGEGDRMALRDAIWGMASDSLYSLRADAWIGDSGDYIGEAECEERANGNWGPQGDTLFWWFPDYAGCCAASASLWVHWMNRVFAARWASLTLLAERHRLEIVSEVLDLAALLSETRFTYLRLWGNWWRVGEEGLFGDDAFIPVEELTPAQRVKHAEALKQCLCGLCRTLRRKRDRRASSQGGGVGSVIRPN